VEGAAEPTPSTRNGAYVDALERLVPREFAERLRATRGQADHERRLVTILFCDVRGSTHMAEDLDPEEVIAVMQGAFEVLIEPIVRYEGTVARLMGDAVLAFFGAPVAHEDDPERAIRAALEIVAGARAYAGTLAQERGIGGFDVRVGINTGLVVVGEVGSDLRVEYTAMGDAINLAARMEQHAPPGGVLITHDTYRHVRGVFDVRAQEPLWVKGRSEPVRTYLVERAKPRAFRMETRGVEGIETRMVGREPELLILQNTYRDVLEDSELRVVTVVGEAGVGKSRLLDEFLKWIELQPERTWYFKGRAAPGTQGAPYGLWRELFANRFGILESDSAAAVQGKLREGMAGQLEPARADLVGHLVGFDLSGSAAVAAALRSGGFAEAATGQLAEYFRGVVGQGPAVVVLEDLHWADDSSLDLVARLVAEVAAGRLLVVAAARPLLIERRPSWGEGLSAYTRLELQLLTKRASRALVGEILQRVELVPEELRELVVAGAEGNPFYVEELIKILIEGGVIEQGDDAWQVSLERLAKVQVPPTLTAVLQARLDALSAEEKGVLQRASVVGREFWDQLVAELATGAVPREDVSALLGELRARELVYRHEGSAFAGTEEYAFKHSVLRDVTYETVLLSARRRYHAQVARWLEAHAGERLAEYVQVIAAHCELAGESGRAVEYLLRAADRARNLGAFKQAIGDYERALAALREGGEADRTARTLMKLGLAYHNAFEFERARSAYEEGFAQWQKAAEGLSAALQPAPHALRVHWRPVSTLDPAFATDAESIGLMVQLFSGLVSFDREWNVVPDVAARWEVSDQGRRYVFHLRDDVTWSDGVRVTAGDFEFAWRRMLDAAIGCPNAEYLYALKGAREHHAGGADLAQVGVRALDERTLLVELEGATGYFLQLLAFVVASPAPRHRVRALGRAWAEPHHIVTNGAFRLTGWEKDRRIVLERDPTYHGRFAGNVQQIVLAVGDPAEGIAAYEADNLDVVYVEGLASLDAEALDRARQRCPDQYLSTPQLATMYLGFDVSRPPFDDLRVRRALALTIDREWLAGAVLKGLMFPATGGIVPPGMPGHSAGIGLPYDPEQARGLLAEAGYPNGRGFPPVECVVPRGAAALSIASFVSGAWLEHLGLRLSWTDLEWRAVLPRIEAAPPHLHILCWIADYPDPDNFLRVANWRRDTRWRNQVYDDLLEAAERSGDPEQRLQTYQRADRLLMEQAPIVPIANERGHQLLKPWVRFMPHAVDMPRWQYWIVEPH
jgi:ABC-type oligopeptide transport system substrate-binding subunit/class 3 adenylate cyclase